MIEQNAIVIELDGATAWVETSRQSICGACAVNKGCGAGVLAKAFGFRSPVLRVLNTPQAEVGEQVVLGIDEQALVRGSLAAYLAPLLSMLLFALGAEALSEAWAPATGEAFTVLAGVIGLVIGFIWLRHHSQRIRVDARYQPVILRRADLAAPCNWEKAFTRR